MPVDGACGHERWSGRCRFPVQRWLCMRQTGSRCCGGVQADGMFAVFCRPSFRQLTGAGLRAQGPQLLLVQGGNGLAL